MRFFFIVALLYIVAVSTATAQGIHQIKTPPGIVSPVSQYATTIAATTDHSARLTVGRESSGVPFFELQELNATTGLYVTTYIQTVAVPVEFNTAPDQGIDMIGVMGDNLQFIFVSLVQAYEFNPDPLFRYRGVVQTYKYNETSTDYDLTDTFFDADQGLGYRMWINPAGDTLLVSNYVFTNTDLSGNTVNVYILEDPADLTFILSANVQPPNGTASWTFGASVAGTGFDEWFAIGDPGASAVYLYHFGDFDLDTPNQTLPVPASFPPHLLTVRLGTGLLFSPTPKRLFVWANYQDLGDEMRFITLVYGVDTAATTNWTIAPVQYVSYTAMSCVSQGFSMATCIDGSTLAYAGYCGSAGSLLVFTDIGYGNTTTGIWNSGVRYAFPAPYNFQTPANIVQNGISYNGSTLQQGASTTVEGSPTALFYYVNITACPAVAPAPPPVPPPVAPPVAPIAPVTPPVAPVSPSTPPSSSPPSPSTTPSSPPPNVGVAIGVSVAVAFAAVLLIIYLTLCTAKPSSSSSQRKYRNLIE